jgi:acetyl-CoA acyltransferase
MDDVVIVAAARTPVGKAPNGALRGARPDDLAATVIDAVLKRAGSIAPDEIDDVVMGCAMPEAEQGLNVARIASLRAGVPVSAAGMTINRFCASGLQAIVTAADAVRLGRSRAAIAGGTESMSLIPMGGHIVAPNPTLIDRYPDVYLSTGLVAENHAREAKITREEQDAFALRSHERAVRAIDDRRFDQEIVPVTARVVPQGSSRIVETTLTVDEGPRRDTSREALAKLRPAFRVDGSVTAGNSSQTSDGAAAVLLTSAATARARGLTPLGRFVAYAVAGVEPERFGIGPVPAIRKVLRQTGLSLDDIDLIELNEAFAAQVLACLRELPIDPERLNVNGGAIALGHPLGCTGARLTTSLLHELKRRNGRYGLVTMCVGGGMGAAGIFERIS